MKTLSLFFLLSTVLSFTSSSQESGKKQNIFIITTDGFRWQEVFTGADSMLINSTRFTADTSIANELYWDADVTQRRKKLMPFFWNVIAKRGQLYGNRLLQSHVNMKNIYKISYPGYNELLTGYADWHFIPNTPVNNSNLTILEYLNLQPAYAGKVAAFTSWNIFPFILNEKRGNYPVNSGYDLLEEADSAGSAIINQAQDLVKIKTHTRHDLLTYLSAKEYIHTKHPKVLLLSLGETDESAHSSRYDAYLQQAAMVDKMIAELWYYVQTDPFYKDNTTFIITTDHGRGSGTNSWHTHNLFIKGSGQTWMAMIGPGILPSGEMQHGSPVYGNQLAATIASLLGEKFESAHPIGRPLVLPALKTDKPAVATAR